MIKQVVDNGVYRLNIKIERATLKFNTTIEGNTDTVFAQIKTYYEMFKSRLPDPAKLQSGATQLSIPKGSLADLLFIFDCLVMQRLQPYNGTYLSIIKVK